MLDDDDVNMDEYREAMQDFTFLRNRQGGARPQPKRVMTKEQLNDKGGEEGDRTAVNDAAVVDVLPDSQKATAEKLLQLLRAHDNDVISWTRSDEVSIHKRRLHKTNVVDLIVDVVHSSPSKTITPLRDQFLAALADANIAKTVIKNKKALKRHRVIKADDANDPSDDATISSTT